MSDQVPKLRANGLPDVERIITDHDNQGKAVISTTIPSQAAWQPIMRTAEFFVGYTTRTFPVLFSPSDSTQVDSTPQDIENYKQDLITPPGLSISTGEQFQIVLREYVLDGD